MSKNIVFCADGTWNGPVKDSVGADDSAHPTNVFKLFENLAGIEETETASQSAKERERVLTDADGNVVQHAKYLHGVGDSKNPLAELVGGVLGTGLIARIVRGYTFLSRNYAEGDRIFIIGFSRGAYTARALAGLVADKGLLDAKKINLADRRGAYKFGAAVWHAQRRQRLEDNPDWLGKIEEIVDGAPGFFTSPPPEDQLVKVQIDTVAVWDTVGALGIPEYNVREHARVDSLQFADLMLSLKVSRGFHAVAVDEMREDFTPTLWHPDPGRITQMLFPGAHGDVGGGYPETNDESGLSGSALAWMREELAQRSVRFTAPAHLPKPDAKGMAHCPWSHWPWDELEHGTPRIFRGEDGLDVSPVARSRMAAGKVPAEGVPPAPYNPENLPPSRS
jgi:uncharacterized protein (DUF2235 family)